MSSPSVSICLTTYNRSSLLPSTLDSLLGQDYGDFELIISDNCSTDSTTEICREYAARDPRIRYFRNERNLGMPGNLNAAISRARGEYIANVHDGDVYRSDLISRWKSALDAVPSAAFAFNDYESLSSEGSPRVYRMPFERKVPGERIALHFFETATSCVWGTVMARASAYREAGAFDPAFAYISDVDMWLRLSLRWDAAYVPEPLIRLMPRPADYSLLWPGILWSLAIYERQLDAWERRLPGQVARYRAAFPTLRRRHLARTLLSALRHRRWQRVREGLSVFSGSGDPVLSALAAPFRSWAEPPAWDALAWWENALDGRYISRGRGLLSR